MKKSRLIETQIVTILSTGHFPDPLPDRRPPPHSQHFLSLARVSDIFFSMFDVRHRKAIVCLLLPAVLTFILQSALEALHPIEEDIDFDAGHYHAEGADGPVVHDLGRRDLGEHDQHYCAHPNASGRVAAPTAAFQCLSASAAVYIEARSILICPFFAVFERGPPLL